MVVCLIAEQLADSASEENQARLILAAGRLGNGLDMAGSIGTSVEVKNLRKGHLNAGGVS